MAILFGFILLFMLLLGGALFLLSLIFLAMGIGIQLFGIVVGSGAIWVPPLATGIQLAASSAFALGIVLVAIGCAALLFPPVRAFVNGLVLLFRLVLSPAFAQLLDKLPQFLRQIAAHLDFAGKILIDPSAIIPPEHEPDSNNQPLKKAGQTLCEASDHFPDKIQTVSFTPESLWLTVKPKEGKMYRESGYVPNPSNPPPQLPKVVEDMPEVKIAVEPSLVEANNPVKTNLNAFGISIKDFGENIVTIGQAMRAVAALLNDIAELMDLVMQ